MNPPSSLTADLPTAVINPQQAAPQEPGVRFRSTRRTASLTGFRIAAIGSCIPERIVTNEELERSYGFEEGWVLRRTGISQRRFAAPDQSTSDLAVDAARTALANAGIPASDIDLLVVGTFTPDYTCPSTACLVQNKLQLDAPAMDIQAACSGFMYSLATAAQFIASGNSRCALVIGADINSRIVRPDDQRTAPLFGDGAGLSFCSPATVIRGSSATSWAPMALVAACSIARPAAQLCHSPRNSCRKVGITCRWMAAMSSNGPFMPSPNPSQQCSKKPASPPTMSPCSFCIRPTFALLTTP